MMDKIGIAAVALVVAPVVFILAALLSTLAGAFIGWVVGWFFGSTLLSFFAALGITGFKMWQIGASLGFIGSFFKSTYTSKK